MTPSPSGAPSNCQSHLPDFRINAKYWTSEEKSSKRAQVLPSRTNSGIAGMVGILNANDFEPSTNIFPFAQLPGSLS